jgi:Ca2+/H+ antiporter, TMEM165/GDT1 family
MSFDKIIFAFIIVLALTLNLGFVAGDITNIEHHNRYELFASLVVSLIATVMKFGDRSQLGSTMLATSLVADVQLIGAAVFWAYASQEGAPMSVHDTVTVVSLAIGALAANVVSVVLLLVETATLRR